MIYTSISTCKSNASDHQRIAGHQDEYPFPGSSSPFPPCVYRSYLNNSHRLLVSPTAAQKRPTMSDCSHQMGSRMQQVGQMARHPGRCCRDGRVLPGALSPSCTGHCGLRGRGGSGANPSPPVPEKPPKTRPLRPTPSKPHACRLLLC